ncbi:MAG: chorismate-binding protein [Syntrophaceae bacterium]|nr:chorismate-binding protein [Syntrophaceae bacterium]
MDNGTFTDTIDTLIGKHLAFALFFRPEEEEPELIVQTTGGFQEAASYDDLNGISGFVFAPFNIQHQTPLAVIRPDLILRGFNTIATLNAKNINPNPMSVRNRNQIVPLEMNKTEYIQMTKPLIQMLQDGECEKVVLSRAIGVALPQHLSLGKILLKLKANVNNAFVCLVNLPGVGTWMGATPELLLTKHDGHFHTVSLAGTLPRNEDGDIGWTAKEFREQEIVTEFIEAQLKSVGIDGFTKSGPFTSFAGNVAHLKTEIAFPAAKAQAELGRFINALHPTSAVCGSSREKAREFIMTMEKHDHEYYCGFLGEWNLFGRVNLYVNIRCMKLICDKACLFVGGGITADSIVEKEWEETQHKAQTLLCVLN